MSRKKILIRRRIAQAVAAGKNAADIIPKNCSNKHIMNMAEGKKK